jgi:hypothetical protein
MEVDVMRVLTITEMAAVTGGTGECTPENSGNDYMGVKNTESVGQELIEIYEGVVAAASHIIERVAGAL